MVDLQLGTKKNRSTLMGGISVVMEFSVICPTGMRRSVPNIARVCSRETWSRHSMRRSVPNIARVCSR